MKLILLQLVDPVRGPAPQGAGGLKSESAPSAYPMPKSRPARGGWIEIHVCESGQLAQSSRPARGGWIEIKVVMLVT